jgi:Flp pilus assembly protein TadB
MSFWLKINTLLPDKLSERFQRKVRFGGEKASSKKLVGFVFGFPFFVGLAVAIDILAFFSKNPVDIVLGFILAWLASFITLLLIIDYSAMGRAKVIESNLPNALELIATNINAGLIVENALIESARPEFGEIATLLKRAAKEMFSGESLENALEAMVTNVDSETLRRTVWLINEGIRKGGSFGDLLLRISKDLREEDELKKEINANISMYIMMILVATVLGGPLLYGAGTIVSEMMVSQASSVDTDMPTSSIPFASMFSADATVSNDLTIDSVRFFSLIALTITTFFGSLLIGIIKYNKETQGLRYFVPLLVISVIFYFAVIFVLSNFVGVTGAF